MLSSKRRRFGLKILAIPDIRALDVALQLRLRDDAPSHGMNTTETTMVRESLPSISIDLGVDS